MSALPQRKLTVAEYLEIERAAEIKSEFYNGEMFAMAGGSKAHNLIASNVGFVLNLHLRQRDCLVFGSDMRVKIERINKYTYPDISVTCGKQIFEEESDDALLNPVLIVEILSPSTSDYDHRDKFQHYQFLKSLQEYIVISQNSCRLEQYVRELDWQWKYRIYSSLDDVVKLESIDCELPLREVYLKVPRIVSAQ